MKTNIGSGPIDSKSEEQVNDSAKLDNVYSAALVTAAKEGNAELVNRSLKAGANINFITKDGETPLLAACANGHWKIAEGLLKEEGIIVDAANKTGVTALIYAAQSGSVELVDKLLKAGANPNLSTEKGLTALFAAVKREHESITLNLLMSGANPMAALGAMKQVKTPTPSPLFETPITMAELETVVIPASTESLPLAEEKPAIAISSSQNEPTQNVRELIIAARNGNLELVEQLLNAGVNYNISTEKGVTPLLAASAAGQWSIVERLLQEKDINVNAVESEQGRSALHYAVQFNSDVAVDMLIQAGANPNIADNNSKTPLDLLIPVLGPRVSLMTRLNDLTTDEYKELFKDTSRLKLENYEFKRSLQRLLAAPQNQRQILDLTNMPLTVARAKQLEELITKHDIQLCELNLTNARIGETILPFIVSILKRQKHLEKVVLNHNTLDKPGLMQTLRELICCTPIHELHLEQTGITEQSARQIATWLSEGSMLGSIWFSNEIGLGIQALCAKEPAFITKVMVDGSIPVTNSATPTVAPLFSSFALPDLSTMAKSMIATMTGSIEEAPMSEESDEFQETIVWDTKTAEKFTILEQQGLVKALVPPTVIAPSDTLPSLLALTAREESNKDEAIMQHGSQASQNSIAPVASTFENPTTDTKGHGLYDYARWSDEIEKHPQTGEDIFTWIAYKNNEATGTCDEVGHVKFYFNKLWCASEEKDGTNILSTSGIFTNFRDSMDKWGAKHLINTCGKMPPTLLERLGSSATRGALNGAAIGISNVVEKGMVQHGYSKQAASYTQKATCCALVYAINFNQRLQQVALGEASSDKLMLASLQAGIDTGMFVLTNAAMGQFSAAARWASRKAQEKGYPRSSQLLGWMGSLGQFGTHIYNAVTNDPIETVTSLSTSIGAQQLVETGGQQLLRRI